MTEIDDETLAGEAAAGSRPAFRQLVERHGTRVRSVLATGVRDDHLAEDLAQEVWLKVHAALPRFRADGRFRPWLFSITYNHLRDALRRRKSSRLVYLDDFREVDHGEQDPDALEAAERRAGVQRALDRVPEPFRGAVGLVDVAGLAYGEAARVLGCTVGTVKSRVHRGRLAFREAWQVQQSRAASHQA